MAVHAVAGVLVLVAGLVLHMTLVYGGILRFLTRMPLRRFMTGAAPVQLVHFAIQRVQEQLHQRLHLVIRAAPVFAGEREQGQRRDGQFQAAVDGAVDRACAGAVADHARAATAFGPAAVAVHDDGNVPGQLPGVESGPDFRFFVVESGGYGGAQGFLYGIK